jgi:hypothetical protein
MATRTTDEARLLGLIAKGLGPYEVLTSLRKAGIRKQAAGDLLWRALRAGSLDARFRAGLFAMWSPYLEAMAEASSGFDAGDLQKLFFALALALSESNDVSAASAWDAKLDALLAACTGDKTGLSAAHASLSEPARARIGAALARAKLLDVGDADGQLEHAADCVLYGGSEALLATVDDAERARLVLAAATRPADPRRFLSRSIAPYFSYATEEQLVAVGRRAWGARPLFDALAARGDAARPALEREADRLLAAPDAEDDDWLVAVTGLIASGFARAREPFPERLRPLVARCLALSRAPRKTMNGPAYPRENPFYAFEPLAPLLNDDDAIALALRCFSIHVHDAVNVLAPLGERLLPALRARASALLDRDDAPLEEIAVVVIGLGRLVRGHGEVLDAVLDPLLAVLVSRGDELVTDDVRRRIVAHDAAATARDARYEVAELLRALPVARREALLLGAAEPSWYFYNVCATPAVAAHAVARAVALDRDWQGARDRDLATLLAGLGSSALAPLLDALGGSARLAARAALVGALANLGAVEALPVLAAALVDREAQAEARRGIMALNESARLAFARERLADRDRAARLVGALVLETVPPTAESMELARQALSRERAAAVREVLARFTGP